MVVFFCMVAAAEKQHRVFFYKRGVLFVRIYTQHFWIDIVCDSMCAYFIEDLT